MRNHAPNRISTALAFALALGGVFACMHEAPDTEQSPWEAGCEGTNPGNTCLVLRFSPTQDVQENAKAGLRGNLHWAVYRGGDVGLFGPGDAQAIFKGKVVDVDLTRGDASAVVRIPDVVPQPYQALAFLDHDMDGKSGSGDVVTFPSDAFYLYADRPTTVRVLLDYVR